MTALLALTVMLVVCTSVTASASGPPPDDAASINKIRLDLSALDEEGLIGPPDGLRSLAYEFCIPAHPARAAEVRAIDPSAEVSAGSPGRIGCRVDQYLVVGNTHQPGFRQVLASLAQLEYVTEIRRTDFE